MSSTFSPPCHYLIREWFYSRLVSREMDIYDKNSRCLMSEGEYELLLSEDLTIPNGDLPNKRNGSWENVSTNVLFGTWSLLKCKVQHCKHLLIGFFWSELHFVDLFTFFKTLQHWLHVWQPMTQSAAVDVTSQVLNFGFAAWWITSLNGQFTLNWCHCED